MNLQNNNSDVKRKDLACSRQDATSYNKKYAGYMTLQHDDSDKILQTDTLTITIWYYLNRKKAYKDYNSLKKGQVIVKISDLANMYNEFSRKQIRTRLDWLQNNGFIHKERLPSKQGLKVTVNTLRKRAKKSSKKPVIKSKTYSIFETEKGQEKNKRAKKPRRKTKIEYIDYSKQNQSLEKFVTPSILV